MVERNENFHLDAVTFFGTSIVNNAQNSSRVSHLLLDIYIDIYDDNNYFYGSANSRSLY